MVRGAAVAGSDPGFGYNVPAANLTYAVIEGIPRGTVRNRQGEGELSAGAASGHPYRAAPDAPVVK